jgi:nickel transport protein
MFHRDRSLIPPALLLSVAALLGMTGPAWAHRLDAQAFLKGNELQVEAWFSSGEPARGARIEIYGADGRVVADGRLDDNGIFTCSLERAEALRIVVVAGADHRKELLISAADMLQKSSEPVPLADHSSSVPVKDILIGVSFLLALAAFVLNYRNSQKIRKLRAQLAKDYEVPIKTVSGAMRES